MLNQGDRIAVVLHYRKVVVSASELHQQNFQPGLQGLNMGGGLIEYPKWAKSTPHLGNYEEVHF